MDVIILDRTIAAQGTLLESSPRRSQCSVETFTENLAWRQLGEVLGDVDATLTQVKDLDRLFFLSRAEDDRQRRLFAGLTVVTVEPT